MDEFGHTHSEDYLAVTVWYDAQEQLRTLVKGFVPNDWVIKGWCDYFINDSYYVGFEN